MKYSVTAKSVVGRIRRNNEDNFFLDGELLSLNHKDSLLLSKTFTDEKSHLVGVFDGGFNLQIAWSTGFVAGNSVLKDKYL